MCDTETNFKSSSRFHRKKNKRVQVYRNKKMQWIWEKEKFSSSNTQIQVENIIPINSPKPTSKLFF